MCRARLLVLQGDADGPNVVQDAEIQGWGAVGKRQLCGQLPLAGAADRCSKAVRKR